jgi:hypothetical protein
MVVINNKNISVLPNDTLQTFKVKVASVFNTIPKYLNFPEKLDILDKSLDITIEDLLEITQDFQNNISFQEYLLEIQKYFKNISTEELVKLWTAYNKIIFTNKLFQLSAQQEIDSELGESKFDIDRFEKNEFLASLKSQIQRNKNEESKVTQINKELKKLKDKDISDFDFEKISIEIETSVTGYSLNQIFDDLKTSVFLPFISFNNFFKIFYEFIPDNSFLITQENVIISKFLISEKITKELNPEKDFGTFYFFIKDEKLFIEISADSKVISNSKDIILNKLSSSFQTLNISIINQVQKKVTGVYFIADIPFNKYIFSDLVMNNDVFSNFLVIDEGIKIAKKKSGVYIYFFDPSRPEFGEVRASIVPKKALKSDLEIRDKNRDIFPYNSDILRVKISRSNDIQSVKHFQTIFNKLLNLYSTFEDKISKIYKEYIPSFKLREKTEEIKDEKLSLKDIASDLFIPKYSRVCQKKPTIISEDEVKKYKQDEYQVMKFPKDGEKGTQRFYICEHQDRSFPGLSLNTLSNKDIYPYVPCCFKRDQIEKNESYYKEYYFGEKVQEGEQQRLLTTNKFIQPNKFAKIPSNLELLFSSFSKGFEYLRKGVSRSKNSFIECISDVVKDDNLPSYDNSEDRTLYITELRKNLVNNSLEVCKQECYDLTLEEIKNIIEDNETYFDPKLFIRLLEEKFKVNIYLFSRDYGTNEGKMILPRHINGHFYYPGKHSQSILIYEHLGNESDRAGYPQCEVLYQWDKNEGEEGAIGLFETSTSFIKKIMKLYNIINKEIYILSKQNKPLSSFINEKDVLSQDIDQYGKVRGIHLKQGLFIQTSPIPPFNILSKSQDYKENDLNQVLTFLKDNDISVYQQIIENRKAIGVTTFKDEISLSFPIKNVQKLKDIEVSDQSILNFTTSELSQFRYNKKLSNFLVQNFLHYYSMYIKDKNQIMNNTSILKFIQEQVDVKENVKYSLIENNFTNKSLYSKGKIILPSEETLKRLIFILRKEIIQNSDYLKEYYSLKFIKNFYNEISDFKRYPFEIILYSIPRVLEYISTPKPDVTLYSTIQTKKKGCYFLILNDSFYLAQESENIKECLFRSIIWSRDGYNPQQVEEIKSNPEYTLLLFNSIDDIQTVIKGKTKNNWNIKIAVYKKDGQIRYQSLMQI